MMKASDLKAGDRFWIRTPAHRGSHYLVTGHREDPHYRWTLVRDLNDQPLASTSFTDEHIDWWLGRGELVMDRDVQELIARAAVTAETIPVGERFDIEDVIFGGRVL